MMLLLHVAFTSIAVALCYFRNGPLGSGYFLSFAIRMRHPFDAKKGDAAIITRFLQLGYVVLTPYGGNQRYDLVIEDADGNFWRIQCKSAWIDDDGTVLKFDTANHNVTGKNRQLRHYQGQCEYFALYSAELNKVYLIPVDEVGSTRAHLRLTPPKNKNQYGYRMASDYEL